MPVLPCKMCTLEKSKQTEDGQNTKKDEQNTKKRSYQNEMKQTNDTINRQNEFDLMRWCKYEN